MKFVVILSPPGLDLSSRIVEVSEYALVQTLIPEPRVEGLDECVLVRLSRGDKVMFDSLGRVGAGRTETRSRDPDVTTGPRHRAATLIPEVPPGVAGESSDAPILASLGRLATEPCRAAAADLR